MSADDVMSKLRVYLDACILGGCTTPCEPARISTYRTEAGSEVDLIVEKDGETVSVEIKSGTRLSPSDFSGVRRFADATGRKRTRSMLIYAGTRAYRDGDVTVLPWRQGLQEIADFLQ